MKNLYFFVLIFLFPTMLPAQAIHGIWSGTLVNDSTHRTQQFELGLSEYRGKITGYTYTTFIDNDTFYYSIKRIRAERKDGKLVIEDIEMVGNNFPERVSKRVKQTTTFPLINDSTIDISNGRWSTNQTKKYYSIGGSAKIREQEDDKQSDLLSHLQELDVRSDITVNTKEKKEEENVPTSSLGKKSKPGNEQKITENKNAGVAKNSAVQSPSTKTTPVTDNTQKQDEKLSPADKKQNKSNQNPSTYQEENSKINTQSNDSTKKINISGKNVTETKNAEQNLPAVSTVAQKKDDPVADKKLNEKKRDTTISVSSALTQNKESVKTTKELPAVVSGRKTETMEDIHFKNDSLVLSIYDNGIVDGDTVSVFINGENVISKQKLKEAATKKTIYISPNTDSLQLVLFADNLGTIPPNTGLLTVRDGDDVYQVRFTADLQKNASIILRRKKEK